MRVLIAGLVLVAAAPAAAQPYFGLAQSLDAQRAAEAQAARNRDIALTNALSALQARQQTNESLAALAAARVSPAVPTVPFNPKAPPPKIDMSQIVEIPDATLAASNARAVAASENRR
ncbi:hypothetical protein [Phenylobacterium sp.]|uniref:hypothetical protein n=1 Tax=Phenylobacterium sp. TaxID=1871053 RepID=UPI0012242D43|nr:hypothetical protein [Phenylobacterium sp.]THD50682.1 MAG: hypothetical protein E8A12_22280 [Phenylobacterium sp.]